MNALTLTKYNELKERQMISSLTDFTTFARRSPMPGRESFIFAYFRPLSREEYLFLNLNDVVLIPNRTFLLPLSGTSVEVSGALVRSLTRRSRAKIPMVRPNEPGIPPKSIKKLQLSIHHAQIRPNDLDSVAISSQ